MAAWIGETSVVAFFCYWVQYIMLCVCYQTREWKNKTLKLSFFFFRYYYYYFFINLPILFLIFYNNNKKKRKKTRSKCQVRWRKNDGMTVASRYKWERKKKELKCIIFFFSRKYEAALQTVLPMFFFFFESTKIILLLEQFTVVFTTGVTHDSLLTHEFRIQSFLTLQRETTWTSIVLPSLSVYLFLLS